MSTQTEFEDIMRKIAQDYGKLNEKQQEFAIREIDRIRLEIADLLAEYAGSDGTIKRQRLNSLLRELERIEKLVREAGVTAIGTVASETAAFTTTAISGALASTLGTAAIAGPVFDRINKHTFNYVVKRFGEDGLVMSDRVWNLAGDQRAEISKVLRSGILRGESVSKMTAAVRQVYDTETWKIRRLVITEGNTANRAATAYNAAESDVVKGLKINDRPGHNNHAKHRCYELAQIDKYGWGDGIYKPSDSEIFSPHPNCTSYLTYVLKD
jgi:hypothetical protein